MVNRAKVNRIRRKLGCLIELRLVEQTIVDQGFQADQIWIPGKRTKALIGTIPIPRWPEWQHLPEALPRLHKEVDPLIGLAI